MPIQNLPAGGLYNSVNLQLYHYAANNPLKYSDPTGEVIEMTGTPLENDAMVTAINKESKTQYKLQQQENNDGRISTILVVDEEATKEKENNGGGGDAEYSKTLNAMINSKSGTKYIFSVDRRSSEFSTSVVSNQRSPNAGDYFGPSDNPYMIPPSRVNSSSDPSVGISVGHRFFSNDRTARPTLATSLKGAVMGGVRSEMMKNKDI